MKNKLLLPLVALAAGLAFNATAADDGHAKPTDKDAAWLAKARTAYPLKTCVTSEEALGSMGETIDLIYRQDGSPDRLVRFCCESCIDDFKKEPAKYLKVIDAAAKSAAKPHH